MIVMRECTGSKELLMRKWKSVHRLSAKLRVTAFLSAGTKKQGHLKCQQSGSVEKGHVRSGLRPVKVFWPLSDYHNEVVCNVFCQACRLASYVVVVALSVFPPDQMSLSYQNPVMSLHTYDRTRAIYFCQTFKGNNELTNAQQYYYPEETHTRLNSWSLAHKHVSALSREEEN